MQAQTLHALVSANDKEEVKRFLETVTLNQLTEKNSDGLTAEDLARKLRHFKVAILINRKHCKLIPKGPSRIVSFKTGKPVDVTQRVIEVTKQLNEGFLQWQRENPGKNLYTECLKTSARREQKSKSG